MALLDTDTLFAAIALIHSVGGILVFAGRDPLAAHRAEAYWLTGSLLMALIMLCFSFTQHIGYGLHLLLAAALTGLKSEFLSAALGRLTETRRPWWAGRGAALLQSLLLIAGSFISQNSSQLHALFLLTSGWFFAGLAWLLLCKRSKRDPAAQLVGGCCSVLSLYLLGNTANLLLFPATAAFNDPLHMLLGVASAVILQIGFVQIQRDRQYRKLHKLAALDPLTGIFNRRTFLDLALRQCAQHGRQQRTLSLLMIDLDHFKQVNDTYGHSTGDHALRAVADCLADEIRQGDILARIGGEEFCLLLPDTSLEGARQVAHKLCLAISRILLQADNQDTSLSASIGIASSAADGSISWNQLFDTADQRLYAAKSSGRNRVVWTDSGS